MERIAVVLGLTFIMLSASILILPSANPDGHGAYPPPAQDDWIVTNDTVVENETIVLNGNLIVEDGGNLTLMNVTLKMNCAENGSNYILVKNGGAMHVIDGSNITSNTPDGDHRFDFWVKKEAVFQMRKSELHECGYSPGYGGYENSGLFIEADHSIISDCLFSDNKIGMTISNVTQVKIENSTFENNAMGLALQDGFNYSVSNCIARNNGMAILMYNSNHNRITNNQLLNNYDGLSIFRAENTVLINNTIAYNHWGAMCTGMSYSRFRNNIFINNARNFGLAEASNFFDIGLDIDTSNTINGLKIFYLSNVRDIEVSPETGYDDVGYIAIVNSFNVTVCNLSLRNNTQGLSLINSSHIKIINLELLNNTRGIALIGSSFNNIDNCKIIDNSNGIIVWENSHNNSFHGCELLDNRVGIWFRDSRNNTVYHNNFISNDNHISGNHINDNRWNDGYYWGNYWDNYDGLDDGSNNRTANDGIGDTDIPHLDIDHFPFMIEENLSEHTHSDLDNDGILDRIDPDIDNDGFPNDVDKYPLDEDKWKEDDGFPINMLIGIVVIIVIIIGIGIMIVKKKKTE
jgi:parallel beta-helix repeat protein